MARGARGGRQCARRLVAAAFFVVLLQSAAEPEAAAASIPLLGFGTANVLHAEPILEAIRSGYGLIDTASLYLNHKAVGEALRNSSSEGGRRREDLYLVTKVSFWPATLLHPLLRKLRAWSPYHLEGLDHFLKGSKGHETEALEAALEELGVQHLDLCLVHSPVTSLSEFLLAFVPHRIGRFGFWKHAPRWFAPTVRGLLQGLDFLTGGSSDSRCQARKESWQALEQAKARGLCREIGVSNYALHLLKELEAYAVERPSANEVEMHPRFWAQDFLDYCQERGIHVIGYGNGLSLEEPAREIIAGIAEGLGRSASQISLRWAVQRNVTVLPRSSQKSRIQENAEIFDFELPAEAVRQLDALREDLPFYWDTSALRAHSHDEEPQPEL